MKIDLSLLALLTTCTQLLTGVEKEERTHQSSPNGAKEGSGNGKKGFVQAFSQSLCKSLALYLMTMIHI